MTPNDFNITITHCIALEADRENPGFPCYPIIGIGGGADDFRAWDNDRQVLLAGVFSEALTQDAINRAIAVATKASQENSVVDVVPCVLTPHDALVFAYSDDILSYIVEIVRNGMLAGALEFTDVDGIDLTDDEDDDETP